MISSPDESNDHEPLIFLSAFSTHPDYRAVLDLLEAHAPLLHHFGIHQICHRPGSSNWARESLSIGPDFSFQHVQQMLQTLEAMGQLSRYFSTVHFGVCSFPQTAWALNYILANIDDVRGRFHTVRFNEHFAAYGGTLSINVESSSRDIAFMTTLLGMIQSAPLLENTVHLLPLEENPNFSDSFEPPAVSVEEEFFDQPLEAGCQFRGNLASAMVLRLFPHDADALALQTLDADYTTFAVMQGEQFLGWTIQVAWHSPFEVTVEQSVQDEEGTWTTQPYFQGTLEEWDETVS